MCPVQVVVTYFGAGAVQVTPPAPLTLRAQLCQVHRRFGSDGFCVGLLSAVGALGACRKTGGERVVWG